MVSSEQDIDWGSELLSVIGLSPQYSYSGGRNVLRINVPLQPANPVVVILVSVLSGLLLGLIGDFVLPDIIQETIAGTVLTPVYNMWIRILNLVSSPVIFLMVLTTALSIGKISEKGVKATRLVAHYFVISTMFCMIMTGFALLFIQLPFLPESVDSDRFSNILDMVLRVVPGDAINPFITANTPQLIFIALVLGNVLTIAGSRAENLVQFIREANITGMLLSEGVSRMVPVFTFLLLGLEIWNGNIRIYTGLWKCTIIFILFTAFAICAAVFYVSIRKEIGFREILKKTYPSFKLALKRGSSEAAFGLCERCCTTDLGIEKGFANMGLSMGMILYMPISTAAALIVTIYAAGYYHVAASPVWYAFAIVLSVVLFIATPPVPGANLLAYATIFAQLGIPQHALIAAMMADMLFGVIAAAGNQLLLQMDLLLQADRLGLRFRRRRLHRQG